ncbi:uncharacterized protein N7500_006531 [Penicillium coprophilum]|uniref:uncharacterized protein n=1 Tax=Penicillium coprophilum TaxID=36646 RepID=UPI0023A6F517|nr:uncharacterized protein N7500_006531 [Penicillium coprophilum]KAJ5164701.1 hypothetical protein N7500_006531 [Penicillium coprophilum]
MIYDTKGVPPTIFTVASANTTTLYIPTSSSTNNTKKDKKKDNKEAENSAKNAKDKTLKGLTLVALYLNKDYLPEIYYLTIIIVGYTTYEGEHYWLNYLGINKLNYMISVNLLSGSLNSVFALDKIAPISIDLVYRCTYYTSKDRVRKIEIYTNSIKLKKGIGVIYPYAPYIKGKGYTLPFGKVTKIKNRLLIEPLITFLIPKEKRSIKLDSYIEEAKLIAYDKGDNYVLYNNTFSDYFGTESNRPSSPPSPIVEDLANKDNTPRNNLLPTNPTLFEDNPK